MANERLDRFTKLLKEIFEYESPEVIVFNVLSLKYGEAQSESYNRMTLDGMKLSEIKIEAVKASMPEDETLLSYVFPILRYHSRWKEVNFNDFRSLFSANDETVSDSGYLMQTEIVPQTSDSSAGAALTDYTLPNTSLEYLEKIRELCDKNGAELVLVKSPTNNWKYYWYDEWDEQVISYAAEHSLKYYNFINLRDEIGIDFSTDTYDGGIHLNVYGAEKLTSYFGDILVRDIGLTDKSDDKVLSEFWDTKLRTYYDRKSYAENHK